MVFERPEGGSKRCKIFAIWIYTKLIKYSNDIKLYKIFISNDISEYFLDKRYRIVILDCNSIEFPIVNIEIETSIILLNEEDW